MVQDELLAAVAQASERTGRRIHMHLLETALLSAPGSTSDLSRRRREVSRQHRIPEPRLTLAHCTWARPDELELLAERGVTIAVNTSSNLGLRSGIAPLKQMLGAAAAWRSASTA